MRLPPGTDARLGFASGGPYWVFLAVPPIAAGMGLLDPASRPGSLTALITHDAGVSWPNRRCEGLIEAALREGGAAVLQFETMADALACHGRIRRHARV